jgi:hypothetical protein
MKGSDQQNRRYGLRWGGGGGRGGETAMTHLVAKACPHVLGFGRLGTSFG